MSHPEGATNAMISEPSAKAERARATMKSSLAQVWAWCAVHLRVGRAGGSSLFPLVAQTVTNMSTQTSAAVADAGSAAYQEQPPNAAVWIATLRAPP